MEHYICLEQLFAAYMMTSYGHQANVKTGNFFITYPLAFIVIFLIVYPLGLIYQWAFNELFNASATLNQAYLAQGFIALALQYALGLKKAKLDA